MKTQRKDSFLFEEQVTTSKVLAPNMQPDAHISVRGGKVSMIGHIGDLVRMECSGCCVSHNQCLINRHDMIVLGKALLELAEHTDGEE